MYSTVSTKEREDREVEGLSGRLSHACNFNCYSNRIAILFRMIPEVRRYREGSLDIKFVLGIDSSEEAA